MRISNPGCGSDPPAIKKGIPKTSSSGSINLLEQFIESWQTFYLLNHQFIIKWYNSVKARWQWCIGQGMGQEAQRFYALSRYVIYLYVYMFTNPEDLWILSFRLLRRLHYLSMINWIVGHGWLNSTAVLCFPGKRGLWGTGTESFNSLITGFGSTGNQPPSLGVFQMSLYSHKLRCGLKGLLWITKCTFIALIS